MERLTCENLKKLKSSGCPVPEVPEAPERVLQFGEGNFLRAFAEDFIDRMNEKADFNAKVILVQPRGGHPEAADRFAEQDGLYTLILRGRRAHTNYFLRLPLSGSETRLDGVVGLREKSRFAFYYIQYHGSGHCI